jgi:hypothetical protein
MIGDKVPKGAPLRCRLGRHTGQAEGGTAMYTCPRCGGSYWQTVSMRDVQETADMMINAGRTDEALEYARREIRRRTS